MQLADTDAEIRRIQLDAYRAMSAAERLAIAIELSDDVQRIALDGLARRRPDLEGEALVRQLSRQLYGR